MEEQTTIRPIDEIQRRAARSIAAQHDGVVMALVRERLPNEEIKIAEQLRGRIVALEYFQAGYTEWLLDGKPLVRFWPPELEITDMIMTVNQRYEVIR